MDSTGISGSREFLNGFRHTLDSAATDLKQISEQQSSIPRSDGKWSSKEIIGHLIDSAANNHQRFVQAQFTDDLVFSGYEQEQWVASQRYQQRPWSELIQLWHLYNQHILHIMEVTPADVRKKLRQKHNLHVIASDTISEDEPVTLDYFMRDYVEHMKKHLQQILG